MNKERLAKVLSLSRCFFIVTDDVYFNNIYSTFKIGWVQCKCFIRVKSKFRGKIQYFWLTKVRFWLCYCQEVTYTRLKAEVNFKLLI